MTTRAGETTTRQVNNSLWLRETYVNRTKGYRFGGSDLYEAFTNDVGRLFNSLQKEYGRCRGKVYIDVPVDSEGGEDYITGDGVRHKSKAVGWVFEKEMGYEDNPSEKYI